MTESIRNMATDDFWMLVGFLLVVAIGGAIAAWLMIKRTRLIEDTPTSRIRSAAQGHVELEGIARLLPGEPIVAPLSKQHCVWWKYAIEERRGSGKNSRWVTLDSGTSDEMFELVDATDRCIVDPEHAKVIPNTRLRWYGQSRYPRSVPTRSPLFGFGAYRYSEQRITPESPLYALGWFRTDGGTPGSFDENSQVRELLAEWKQDQAKMAEFDNDGDGQIDLQEWEQARAKAIEAVRAQLLENATHPDIHVLCRPPRRLSFLLSTIPQAKLIQRSKRWAIAGLVGFFGGGSVALYLLTERGVLS